MEKLGDRDLIAVVATQIAEEAAPDEVDLAPLMAQAFIQGGPSRKEMFKQEQGSLTGGFGPGGVMALFPWILKALAQHGPLICQILTTDVADLVGLVNDLLDLSSKLELEETIKALPADPYQPLKLVMTTISQELVSSG